ncbi:Glucosaminyl phosphatidylinositol (GlcN-PI) nositol acylation protein [Naganishia albida]|nr:Glucosaminyl phosphatidylinositol (GlcN-PI) nositol acylation protein [Naganishia albida]
MEYKQAKEAFVAHNPGSSIAKVQAVSLVGWTSYVLYASTVSVPVPRRPSPVRDYLTTFLPLLLGQTVFSSHPVAYNAGIILAALLVRLRTRRRSAHAQEEEPQPPAENGRQRRHRHRPFLTTWRAHMMLMTTIAILAVDFPLFPREFGKTEDRGTSLMDVGVGSFVFSQGLASAMSSEPARTARKCAPVVVLGIVRVLMVKGVDYPEHVTEYGVHWNFFFTLAAMPLLSALLSPMGRHIPALLLAGLVVIAHSVALYAGLERWVVRAENTSRHGLSLIEQNREGLVSLPGYLAIYLLGASIGRVLRPRTTSHTNAHDHADDDGRVSRALGAYAAASWAILYVLQQTGFTVSRRLTNAPYVVWTTAFNTTFLLGYHAIERAGFPRSLSAGRKVPALLDAVNKNGLVFFLLANLLTGLVNVSMETMYASDGVAIAVLMGYTAVLSAVAWGLRGVRVGL